VKVIHTIHSIRSEAGGPAYSVPALAKALQKEGIEVELWTCVPSAVPPHGLVTKCVQPKALAAKMQEAQKANPNLIIHDHGVWLPWNHQVAKAAAKAKIPRVVSPRGMLEPWAMGYRAAKKWLAWRLYQKRDLQSAALLHATAEAEAQNLRELGLTPPIHVASNGVTLPPSTLVKRPTSNQVRTILFISRLHPKKGLLDLVAAWSRIKNPDWRIRIIGPDEKNHRSEVQAAIAAAGLTSFIHIEPALAGSAKWQAYADADLFVLPSYSENFGLVVAESLACGTPVITTRATPWEELETHRCGWWIETGSIALQETLEKAIELPLDDLSIMGQSGRELIADRYDWASIAVSMRRAYQGLL
jgi:glycosyltransferase involved in cell wall biosynthesis